MATNKKIFIGIDTTFNSRGTTEARRDLSALGGAATEARTSIDVLGNRIVNVAATVSHLGAASTFATSKLSAFTDTMRKGERLGQWNICKFLPLLLRPSPYLSPDYQ